MRERREKREKREKRERERDSESRRTLPPPLCADQHTCAHDGGAGADEKTPELTETHRKSMLWVVELFLSAELLTSLFANQDAAAPGLYACVHTCVCVCVYVCVCVRAHACVRVCVCVLEHIALSARVSTTLCARASTSLRAHVTSGRGPCANLLYLYFFLFFISYFVFLFFFNFFHCFTRSLCKLSSSLDFFPDFCTVFSLF